MRNHPAADDTKQDAPAFFRRRDVLVVGALLLVGLIGLAVPLMRPAGALAVITVAVPEGESLVQQVRLGRDQVIDVVGAPFPVTLEVKDGGIRFVHSQCPDHRCEDFGWLRREGDWALCAPAGVMVRITEDG